MTKPVEACCTSPAAICYWLIVSLITWGVLRPRRNLLASFPCAVSGGVLFCDGHRLRRQPA